jgi:hypothetical protein
MVPRRLRARAEYEQSKSATVGKRKGKPGLVLAVVLTESSVLAVGLGVESACLWCALCVLLLLLLLSFSLSLSTLCVFRVISFFVIYPAAMFDRSSAIGKKPHRRFRRRPKYILRYELASVEVATCVCMCFTGVYVRVYTCTYVLL